jgi:hypothetical protein
LPPELATPDLIYSGPVSRSIPLSVVPETAAPAPASALVLAEPVPSEPVPESKPMPLTEPVMISELGGALMATKPEAALGNLAVGMLRLVDGLLNSRSELAAGLSEQVVYSVAELLQQVYGWLGGSLGGGKAPSLADTPSAPTVPAPPPAPPVDSSTGNSLSGSGSSNNASFLLLGVLASFSILLLEGKFSWPSRELPKPSLALRLAIERPG